MYHLSLFRTLFVNFSKVLPGTRTMLNRLRVPLLFWRGSAIPFMPRWILYFHHEFRYSTPCVGSSLDRIPHRQSFMLVFWWWCFFLQNPNCIFARLICHCQWLLQRGWFIQNGQRLTEHPLVMLVNTGVFVFFCLFVFWWVQFCSPPSLFNRANGLPLQRWPVMEIRCCT